jgi:hypothetical protein
MKAINKTSKAILAGIIDGLHEPGDAKKLDHVKGSFMALSVEMIAFSPAHYSLAHYGEQNGDLMRDPEVIFYSDGENFYPYYFRNDYAGVERYWVEFGPDGNPIRLNVRQQADLASFCNTWLKNIKDQQGL